MKSKQVEQHLQLENNIKEAIFNSEPNVQIISAFTTYLSSLSTHEIRALNRSRHGDFFKSVKFCKEASFISQNTCLNQTFYSSCQQPIKKIKKCVLEKINNHPEECFQTATEYFQCMKHLINKLYRTSVHYH